MRQLDMQAIAPYIPKPARPPSDTQFLEPLIYVPAFVGLTLLASGLLGKLSEVVLGVALGLSALYVGANMVVKTFRAFGFLFPIVITIPQGPEVLERVEIRFIKTDHEDEIPTDDLIHFLRLSWEGNRFGRDPWRKIKRHYPMPSGAQMTDSYHAGIIEELVKAGIGTYRERVGFRPVRGMTLELAIARLS